MHVSLDDVIIMFHDPSLDRTTNMTGMIREKNWHGPAGMEHALTKKEPVQHIPTFEQTVDLLMKEGNRHACFNVDVKVFNDPDRLFSLMHKVISSHKNWETELAPRIVLGLWHPRFIGPAMNHLPYCTMSHIGASPYIARTYFWEHCSAFSMNFGSMATIEGDRFRKDLKAAGKKLMVWTVNQTEQMMECIRWEADAIITDVPKKYLDLRANVEKDYKKADAQHSRFFLWTTWWLWSPIQMFVWRMQSLRLQKIGGPFMAYVGSSRITAIKAD